MSKRLVTKVVDPSHPQKPVNTKVVIPTLTIPQTNHHNSKKREEVESSFNM